MACIQLYKPFDLTAPTSFRGFEWGPNEDYITYDGGWRLDTEFAGYDRVRVSNCRATGKTCFAWTGLS
jgi:hypothetical protein